MASRKPLFGVATTIVGLIGAAVGVLLTAAPDTSTQAQVVVPVLAGLVSIVVVALSVFSFQLAVAPLRQRNEARGLIVAPVEKTTDVPLTLRNYARQAEDRSTRIDAYGGWRGPDVDFAEEWTNEVVRFLSDRASVHAGEFTELATNVPDPRIKLRLRAQKLREIADGLNGE